MDTDSSLPLSRTSLASEDSPPSIPSAADPDIIISPYELPVPCVSPSNTSPFLDDVQRLIRKSSAHSLPIRWPQFGSDVPTVDHDWLENCYACRDEVNHAPFVSFGRPSLPKKRQRTDRIKRVQKASSVSHILKFLSCLDSPSAFCTATRADGNLFIITQLTTRYAAVTKVCADGRS